MLKNKKISSELKNLILAEAVKRDSSIPNIAKLYSIGKSTIYAWIRNKKALQINDADVVAAQADNFVEVALIDSNVDKIHNLQKAFLEFGNFSLTIEGDLSQESLPRIIKILESIC